MFLVRVGHYRVSPGGWQERETAVTVWPQWSASSSHWQETAARSAVAHLPLSLPSASSTLGPVWLFYSMRKALDSCRKITQSRSQAIRTHIGFSLFSWPPPFYFLWVADCSCLTLYLFSLLMPTLWPLSLSTWHSPKNLALSDCPGQTVAYV